MDKALQELKREAVVSGDFSKYEKELRKSGLKRVVFHRLLAAVLVPNNGCLGIFLTNWSGNDRYEIDMFDRILLIIDPSDLKVGKLYNPIGADNYYSPNYRKKIRLLEIEVKELTVPKTYLEYPPLHLSKK